MKTKKGRQKTQAFFQIFLLVSMSIAVSFIFNESVGVASAQFPRSIPSGSLTGASNGIRGSASIFSRADSVVIDGVKETVTQSVAKDGTMTVTATSAEHGSKILTAEEISTASKSGVDVSQAAALSAKQTLVSSNAQLGSLQAGQSLGNGLSVQSVLTEGGKTTAVIQDASGATHTLTGTTSQTVGKTASTQLSSSGGSSGGFSLGNLFGGKLFGTASTGASIGGALVSGALWGGIVYGLVYLVGGLLGLSSKQTKSLAMGLGAGTFVGTTTYFLANNLGWQSIGAGWSFLIGAGVAAAIIIATYKKEKKEIVRFECLPWEAPLGGQNCERCNEDPLLPCSEYRCKSLGQACDIVNKGSAEEKCIWINREDTQAPHMTPLEESLKPEGLTYRPDPTISPPNTGFRIVKTNGGCLDPFTALEFGVKTDEHAQCKLDWTLTETYDQMQFLFGDNNLFREEHIQRLRVPSPFTEENGTGPEIHNNGIYTLWARCIDANGNGGNSAAVAFRFCVNPGPDTSPPIIEATSITQGSPVQFNVDKVPIEVYTNEPSECKWSRQDKAFDAMENTMNCAMQSFEINANLQYTCSGDLTGVENRADNHFYFRCKDQPNKPENQRNLMTTSHHLLLKGTEELVITAVGPEDEFEGGGGTSVVTVNLTVETGHGANEGAATCYFSDINEDSEFTIAMQGAGTTQHYQPLDLVGGQYTYYFKCVDAGGNSASANTTFNILIDNAAPKVIRALRDVDNLKIITDEDARCSYSLTSCNYNFEEGVAFTYENPTNRDVHLTSWDPGITYYVKCADLQNNQPAPTSCQIVVEGSEF